MSKNHNDLKNSLGALPSISQKATKDKYNYSTEKSKISFDIEGTLLDKFKRDAYWSRKSQTKLIHKILQEYYDGKDFEPIPQE